MALIDIGGRPRLSMPKHLHGTTKGYILILNNQSAIKPEEKVRIRSRALESGAVEPDAKLALHNALLLAKIVRVEFPAEW